jgi:hypothetical protein
MGNVTEAKRKEVYDKHFSNASKNRQQLGVWGQFDDFDVLYNLKAFLIGKSSPFDNKE